MRREEETQAAVDAGRAENRRRRAEVEQLKDALAGHSAPAPESASNDSGAVLCLPSASGIGEATAPVDKTGKVAFFRSLFRGREDADLHHGARIGLLRPGGHVGADREFEAGPDAARVRLPEYDDADAAAGAGRV